jgi:hypothetical protein
MSFLLYLAQKGLFREEDIPEISSQVEQAAGGVDEAEANAGTKTSRAKRSARVAFRII